GPAAVRHRMRRESTLHAQSARRQGLRGGGFHRRARGGGQRGARCARSPRRHRPRHAADLRAAVAEDSSGAARGEIELDVAKKSNTGPESLRVAWIIELPLAYFIFRDHGSNATFRSHAREATGRKHKMSA